MNSHKQTPISRLEQTAISILTGEKNLRPTAVNSAYYLATGIQISCPIRDISGPHRSIDGCLNYRRAKFSDREESRRKER